MTSKAFVIGLSHPRETRKEILESAKLSAMTLKSHYRLDEIRSERAKLMSDLASTIIEIGQSIAKLKKTLPKHSKKDLPDALLKFLQKKGNKTAKPKPAPKVIQYTQEVETKTPVVLSDLERLELQLSDIESKLNKL